MSYLVNIIYLIMRQTAHFRGKVSAEGQKVVSYYYYEGRPVLVGELRKGGPVEKRVVCFAGTSLKRGVGVGGLRGGFPPLS
jgi:hypothetical protein